MRNYVDNKNKGIILMKGFLMEVEIEWASHQCDFFGEYCFILKKEDIGAPSN